MILISHRGNINGRIPEKENHPDYIMAAIAMGYDVEIDVWYAQNSFFLGHDNPEYKIDHIFLINSNLWCHAKNIKALTEMRKYVIHYFWHEEDRVTLTSRNFIWAYPGQQPIPGSIAVLPERQNEDVKGCSGVCSDFIENYRRR